MHGYPKPFVEIKDCSKLAPAMLRMGVRIKMVNNRQIKSIKYCEIHSYIPFVISTTDSIENNIEGLLNSNLNIDNYLKGITATLGKHAANCADRLSEVSDGSGIAVRVSGDVDQVLSGGSVDLGPDELRLDIHEISDSAFTIGFNSKEVDFFLNRADQFSSEQKICAQLYGANFSSSCFRVVLAPFKALTKNGECVCITNTLLLFSNNQAVLKQVMTLENISPHEIFENDIEAYFVHFFTTWIGEGKLLFERLADVRGKYLQKVAEIIKSDLHRLTDVFNHIVLLEFDGQPVCIERISNSIKRDLFFMIASPVSNRERYDHTTLVNEQFSERYLPYSGIGTLLKSTGGCLSFLDKESLDYYLEPIICSGDESGVIERGSALSLIACQISANVELAILVSILKKLNNYELTHNQTVNPQSCESAKEKYYKNRIFIAELQEECYGSVSDQIQCFEAMMPHYFKSHLVFDKLDAMDAMISSRKAKNESALQYFLAVVGFTITVALSLPAIRETLAVAGNCVACFISSKESFLELDLVSILLWIALIIYLGTKLKEFLKKIKE